MEQPVLVPIRRVSYLPAWLKLSAKNLSENRSVLQNALDTLKTINTTIARMDEEACQSEVHGGTVTADVVEEEPPARWVESLPEDVYSILSGFLLSAELHFLSCTCRAVYLQMIGDIVWAGHSSGRWCLDMPTAQLVGGCRAAALRNYHMFAQTLDALAKIRNQNSRRRSVSIKPRRYLRSEAEVSHPLPLDEERVMSYCYAMSSDDRRDAMRTLRCMAFLTSNGRDIQTRRTLLNTGAIVILVALLVNESGAMQELAAATLANLFCATDHQLADSAFTSEAEDIAASCRKVCVKCAGPQRLQALLRSPSACMINGVHSSVVLHIAVKQAARALCNLAVPLVVPGCRGISCRADEFEDAAQRTIGGGDRGKIGTKTKMKTKKNTSAKSFVSRLRRQCQLHADQQQHQQTRHQNLPPIPILPPGGDRTGDGGGAGSAPQQQSPPVAAGTADSASIAVPLWEALCLDFVGRRAAPRWQMVTFHPSGGLRDNGEILLDFFDGQIRGSGVDSGGSFIVFGMVERACGGPKHSQPGGPEMTCFFHKKYDTGLANGGRTADGQWVTPVRRGDTGHISHVGFWCAPSAPSDESSTFTTPMFLEQQGLLESAQRQGFFWGVWEQNSTDTRLRSDLKDGGVFRIFPLPGAS